jgi:hypothetical protein
MTSFPDGHLWVYEMVNGLPVCRLNTPNGAAAQRVYSRVKRGFTLWSAPYSGLPMPPTFEKITIARRGFERTLGPDFDLTDYYFPFDDSLLHVMCRELEEAY